MWLVELLVGFVVVVFLLEVGSFFVSSVSVGSSCRSCGGMVWLVILF